MTSQVAITLLKSLEQSLDSYCELNDEGKTAFRMAITALELFGNSEQLPSAQPDIIRCKDCKYYVNIRNIVGGSIGKCEELNKYPHSEWYCGNAERKED